MIWIWGETQKGQVCTWQLRRVGLRFRPLLAQSIIRGLTFVSILAPKVPNVTKRSGRVRKVKKRGEIKVKWRIFWRSLLFKNRLEVLSMTSVFLMLPWGINFFHFLHLTILSINISTNDKTAQYNLTKEGYFEIAQLCPEFNQFLVFPKI